MGNSFEKRIIELAKKYVVVMIVCVAVCAVGMAKVEGSKASTSYKAKLTVAVTPADGYQKSTLEDIQKNEELVGLYAKISTSSKTLDRVAQYAGLDEKGRIALNSRVAVDFDKDGQYVDIYITADTEDEALKLADAEAKAVVEVGKEVKQGEVPNLYFLLIDKLLHCRFIVRGIVLSVIVAINPQLRAHNACRIEV